MRNRNKLNLLIIIAVLAVAGCVCPPPNSRYPNIGTQSNETAANEEKKLTNVANRGNSNAPKPFDYEANGLQLVSSKWQKGGFGSIAIWKVTIRNISDKPLGDIKFSTEYYSETGNVVSRGGTKGLLGKDTIEKIVPPKSSRSFEVNDGFIGDEATTANFQLESWRVIDK